MSEETTKSEESQSPKKELKPGAISEWLLKKGFSHNVLEADHLGVELIDVQPNLNVRH